MIPNWLLAECEMERRKKEASQAAREYLQMRPNTTQLHFHQRLLNALGMALIVWGIHLLSYGRMIEPPTR